MLVAEPPTRSLDMIGAHPSRSGNTHGPPVEPIKSHSGQGAGRECRMQVIL